MEGIPETNPARLGLLGGTFDPIHEGHLALGRTAADQLQLDEVWVIPAWTPYYKEDRDVTDPALRWEMVVEAVKPLGPRFIPVDYELRRGEFTYTSQTLGVIREAVGADAEIFWIIGYDNVSFVPKWKNARQLVSLAKLAVGGRPGAETPDDVPRWLCDRMERLEGPHVAVSSTEIREQAARGVIDESVVPEPVARIIRREGLYGYRD